MKENENRRIWINRIVSFLFGGLLLFIILQTTVVNDAVKLNQGLEKELDKIRYE